VEFGFMEFGWIGWSVYLVIIVIGILIFNES